MSIARWHLMYLGHGGSSTAHAIQENDGDHGERLGQNWKYKKYFLLFT